MSGRSWMLQLIGRGETEVYVFELVVVGIVLRHFLVVAGGNDARGGVGVDHMMGRGFISAFAGWCSTMRVHFMTLTLTFALFRLR